MRKYSITNWKNGKQKLQLEGFVDTIDQAREYIAEVINLKRNGWERVGKERIVVK